MATPTTTFLRFADLVERGIVRNRVTLSRWIKSQGFPPPVKLGPNTAAWSTAAVEAWVASRPNAALSVGKAA